jgi:hypothetical protein
MVNRSGVDTEGQKSQSTGLDTVKFQFPFSLSWNTESEEQ